MIVIASGAIEGLAFCYKNFYNFLMAPILLTFGEVYRGPNVAPSNLLELDDESPEAFFHAL